MFLEGGNLLGFLKYHAKMIKNAVKWKLWTIFFRLNTEKKIVFVPIVIIRN